MVLASGLKMDNDSIRFHARFGGVSREIFVPVNNVMAIYANENGQGMAFEPLLGQAPAAKTPAPAEETAPVPTLSSVPSAPAPRSDDDNGPDDGGEPPKKGGRPTLTRIK